MSVYKSQRFETLIPGYYYLYSGDTDPRIAYILANFLRSIDISRSDYRNVRAIVIVIFINKSINIVKVPMRLRSSTFELTGVYFRCELHNFGQIGWENNHAWTNPTQKCLISICNFNSVL